MTDAELDAAEAELFPDLPAVPEPPPFHDPDPQEVVKRKRGRPRKQAPDATAAPDEIAAPLDAPMPPRESDEQKPKSAPSPSQAWKLDREIIGLGVSAVFGCIAAATMHEHWNRTPEQCKPISDPLQRLFDKMPATKRKKMLEFLDPGVLLAGIYQVAGPSITEEVRLAQARRQGLILPAPARGKASPPAPRPAEPAPPGEGSDPGKIADATGIFGAVIQ